MAHNAEILRQQTSRVSLRKSGLHALWCGNELTTNRDKWSDEVFQYCSEKYTDWYVDPAKHLQEIENLRHEAVEDYIDGTFCDELPFWALLAARSRMKRNTAGGGETNIVTEMILELTLPLMLLVWQIFLLRFRGELQRPQSWRVLLLNFIAKIRAPARMKDFRGVALMDVFAKLYMSAMMIWVSTIPLPQPLGAACCAAYTRGLCVDDVALLFATVIRKHAEWDETHPAYLFSGDIVSAFDHLSLDTLLWALRSARIPASIAAAIAAELTGLIGRPQFDGIEIEDFTFNKCIRQGGNESTLGWNLVFKVILSQLTVCWRQLNYGIEFDGTYYTHLVWSDNIFLISASRKSLAKMIESFTNVIQSLGFSWKTSESCFISASSGIFKATIDTDSFEAPLKVKTESDTLKIPHVKILKALGVAFDQRADSITMMEYRFQQAQKSTFQLHDCLVSRRVSRAARFHSYVTRVLPSFMHGASAFIWSRELVQRCTSHENLILRKICGFKKRPNETWDWYMMRTYKLARRAYIDSGGIPLASRILEKILVTARKISAQPRDEFWRFMNAAMQWRNVAWWGHFAVFGMQIDPGNKEQWKHPHPGRPRARWENFLIFVFGDNWINDIYEFQKLSARELMRVNEDKGYFFVSLPKPEPTKRKRKVRETEMRPELRMFAEVLLKEKRQVKRVRFTEAPWKLPLDGTIAIEVLTDSLNAVNLVNGKSRFPHLPPTMIQAVQKLIGVAWVVHGAKPRATCAEFVRHIPREKNAHANGLASLARIMHSSDVKIKPLKFKPKMVRTFSDGSWKEDVPNEGGIGVVVEVANEMSSAGEPQWFEHIQLALHINEISSSHEVELFGLVQALSLTLQCVDAKLHSHDLPSGHLVLT